MCGANRYELSDDSPWSAYCHCESCRKHTGAPVAVLIAGKPERVSWTKGERKRYESSAGRFRAFCNDCGTSLTWETDNDGGWLGVHSSTLDNPDALPPTDHVFHAEAVDWLKIDDDLPRFEGSKFITPA
ncbi:MAG: GFA family protein [Granulosicoccaceae bacterium]